MEFAAGEAAIKDGALPLRARRETEVLLERKVREKRKTRPLFYALNCGAGAAAVLFGLFAGLKLPYSAAAMAVAGRDTVMGSSLFGLAVELVRGSLPAANSLYAALLQLFLLLMTGTGALALAACILAFAAGRTARRLAAFTETAALLSFGGFQGLLFLSAETVRGGLALDALFVFAAALLLRVFSVTVRRRGRGLINALLLLLAAACFVGLCLPGSPLKTALTAALRTDARHWGAREIALTALLASAGLGLFFGILRLGAGKGFCFELLRFFLLCAAAGAVFAVFMAEGELSSLTKAPLALLLTALPAPLGLVLSAALLALRQAKKKPKERGAKMT